MADPITTNTRLHRAQLLSLNPERRRKLAAREKLKGLSEVQIVTLWCQDLDAFDLKETEERIYARWEYAKGQFLAGKTYGQTLHAIMDEFNVAISTARNDIRNMRPAFGDLNAVPRELHRQRAMHMALMAYQQAEKESDAAGMAKATQVYITAAGVDKEDPDRPDIEKLMADRNYVEAMDPGVRSNLLNLLQQGGGSLDLSIMFERVKAAETLEGYTDYEELPDEAPAQ